MTDFTFTDPSGKDHTVSGPEGATQEQAFQILQQHLASQPGGAPGGAQQSSGLGDLWQKALSHLPPEVQKQAASLMPSWGHNDASYSPYKPAQPGNMPNDAINPVGNDAQMVGAAASAGGMGGLAAGARALQGAPTPAPPPKPSVPSVGPAPPPIKPGPTQGPWGMAPAPAPVIRGAGGRWMPNPEAQPVAAPAPTPAIPSNPITAAPPLPGTNPQQVELLRQAIHGGSGMVGHALGLGPLGHIAGRGLTKMLGM